MCLQPLPSRLQDEAVRHLAEELTATETVFPSTKLRLVYQLADGMPTQDPQVEMAQAIT